MNKKKVSISDVARHAKVSITTVSRVINNINTVSNKNRARVEEAIALLKFRPNVSAQRLAKGVTNAIGLVMPGYPGIFHSYYAIELIRGVGHACETLRLDLVFHITDGYNPLNNSNVGGIIFADIIENRKQVEMALSINTPCMIINNKVEDLDVSYISIDNRNGGQQAADYLYNLGHRHLATVTGNLNTQGGLHRYEGFKSHLKKLGHDLTPDYVFEGDYSRRSARLAIEKFLNIEKRPTAIFAASDDMALEIMAVVHEKGMKVPDDMSIIGFDDNPSCLYGTVALSTIKQPLFEMAEQAVRALSGIIQGKNKDKVKKMLTPELILRESCAPPKK